MIVRCKNGHYYDDKRYSACPHCGIDLNAFARQMQGQRAADSENDRTLAFDKADESKTMRYSDADDDVKTVSFYSAAMQAEPVVGWLVCVSGRDSGRDFRIKAGRNSIGRANTNDVILKNDLTVAREKHAEIIYDHVSNKTFLVSANSTEVMVDGRVVTAPAELCNRANIRIGETDLVFAAFCCGDFSWDSFGDNKKD